MYAVIALLLLVARGLGAVSLATLTLLGPVYGLPSAVQENFQ
ncbi:hypothetical protein ACRQ5Q_40720 [Bradyrhizobium sp. PMVTL-01]